MIVLLSPKADKQLNKLPGRENAKIIRKLHELERQPFIGKLLTGELKGTYSLRAWPYRIIYEIIKDRRVVFVDAIEHRQGVYK